MTFSTASISSLLLSQERDMFYLNGIRTQVQEAIDRLLDRGHSRLHPSTLSLASSLLYYSSQFPSMLTLGESYSGLVRVSFPDRRLVRGHRLAIWSFLYIALPWLLLSSHSNSTRISWLFSLVSRLHLVSFYFQGRFASLSHRLTGIVYVPSEAEAEAQIGLEDSPFYLFGLLEGLLGLFELYDRTIRSQTLSSSSSSDSSLNEASFSPCSLCLEVGKQHALLPCGHFYCWSCVCRLAPPLCPLCRVSFSMCQVYCIAY